MMIMALLDDLITRLGDDYARFSALDDSARHRAEQAARTLGDVCAAADTDAAARVDLLSRLVEIVAAARPANDDPNVADPLASESLVAEFVTTAIARWQPDEMHRTDRLDTESVDWIVRLYEVLGTPSGVRHQLLRWLAIDASPQALEALARLLVSDPPWADEAIDWAVEPLFRRPPADPSPLYPRLLEGLAHPVVAAVVLDLSHHLLRQGIVSAHPAEDRADEMATLLGNLAERLTRLAETAPDPSQDAESRRTIQQTIARSVALAAGLAEALAWIGSSEHVGKLYQALDVPHRRVVIEAAAALARLGERGGIDTLVRAASDPAARSRALAYLEELDKLHEVDAEHRSREARAAGTLADWLADPTQFGFPPTSVEPIETVTQHWPGYEDAVDCHLLSYAYTLPQGELTGLGIVGPVTHATHVDLNDLPTSDAFAYFAGWHAQHEEITECTVDELTDQERHHLDELSRMLEGLGFDEPRPVKVGDFFGERVIVATAQKNGQQGTVIVSGTQMAEGTPPVWIAAGSNLHPIGADDAYHIYKGRQFLRIFN